LIHLRLFSPQTPDNFQDLALRPENTIDRKCTIGRSPTATVVLDSQEVSRLHGEIVERNGEHYFIDTGSSGGSLLNDVAVIAHQEHPLKSGDVLSLGSFTLKVTQIGDPDAATMVKLPVLTPAQYMPVSAIAPEEFTRWQKGDITVRCAEIIDETDDVRTFRFVAEPPVLFSYKPGQFATLALQINGEEVLRSYSISSTPSRPHSLEITVKRVPAASPDVPPGLVSNWLHDNMKVGNKLQLSGPLGKFTCFQYPSRKLLFISGGSGITPMMGMSRWICDTIANCDIVFFHSARTPADIIYHQELTLLSSRHKNFRPLVTVTQWKSGQGWLGLTGRLNANMVKLTIPDFMERTIFVCGPAAFMEAAKETIASLGFPMENYHEESFGGSKAKKKVATPAPAPAPVAPAIETPQIVPASYGLRQLLRSGDPAATPAPTPAAIPAAAPVASASKIAVMFKKSDRHVDADGEDSILDLADQNGVKIRSSCRSGNCGTCKKKKVSGNVKMSDFDAEALEPSEQEEGYILTCVAFPQDLVTMDA
jgi:glycine betaine catabolism B